MAMIEVAVFEVDSNERLRVLEFDLATEVVPRVGDHLMIPLFTHGGVVTNFWELTRVVHDMTKSSADRRLVFYVKHLLRCTPKVD